MDLFDGRGGWIFNQNKKEKMKHYLICYGIIETFLLGVYLWFTVRDMLIRRFSWGDFKADFPGYAGICALLGIPLAFGLLQLWMFLKLADWML